MLEFPPSAYYAAKKRELEETARDIRDEYLKKEIMRVWEDPRKARGKYGARKVWRQLNRDGIAVARCTVERLMRELGIGGVKAGRKRPRTAVPAPAGTERPSDLLERDFSADAPNKWWVADITYVEIPGDFVYTASSWTCFPGRSSAGRSVTGCRPIWPSMRWRWRSGGPVMILTRGS